MVNSSKNTIYPISEPNFSAGERCDVATLDWYEEKVGITPIDHWWQTESGWPMLSLMRGVEDDGVKRASAGKPIPGYDIKIFDEEGYECRSTP